MNYRHIQFFHYKTEDEHMWAILTMTYVFMNPLVCGVLKTTVIYYLACFAFL
jgi:hypothetical protein